MYYILREHEWSSLAKSYEAYGREWELLSWIYLFEYAEFKFNADNCLDK